MSAKEKAAAEAQVASQKKLQRFMDDVIEKAGGQEAIFTARDSRYPDKKVMGKAGETANPRWEMVNPSDPSAGVNVTFPGMPPQASDPYRCPIDLATGQAGQAYTAPQMAEHGRKRLLALRPQSTGNRVS